MSDCISYEPQSEKTCLWCLRTTKVHPRSLVSTLVIRLLVSIVSKLATSQFSIFWLVSVAEKTGLSLTLLETQKIGLLKVNLFVIYVSHYCGMDTAFK